MNNFRAKIVLNEHEEELLRKYMKENNIKYKAVACRELLLLGITREIDKEQYDIIAKLVKTELESELQEHNKRIKSILFNAGRLSSTSTYFIIGILRDMIKGKKKKNVSLLYEKASKYAVKEVKRIQ
jgi:hypothetical protein